MKPSHRHALLALVSGVIVETLYAVGTLMLVGHHVVAASAIAVAWGAAFLFGVHESFKTRTAAALYCIGLGAGTLLGAWWL